LYVTVVVPPIHDRGSGTLHTFGTGDCGQLGLDKGINKRNYPCPVPGLGDNKVKKKQQPDQSIFVLF
jgi:hypothetical protein